MYVCVLEDVVGRGLLANCLRCIMPASLAEVLVPDRGERCEEVNNSYALQGEIFE